MGVWMPTMMVFSVAIAIVILVGVGFFLGYLFTKRMTDWECVSAQQIAREWKLFAEESSSTKQALEEMTRTMQAQSSSMVTIAKRLEALDFNVGQLTLRLVKEQVRVKGVQVGEEISEEERMRGHRVTAPPIDRGDEMATDGFFVDGVPVDPKKGLERTIASAQPT